MRKPGKNLKTSEENYEDWWGKVRKVMKIDEKWGKLWENWGKFEETWGKLWKKRKALWNIYDILKKSEEI